MVPYIVSQQPTTGERVSLQLTKMPDFKDVIDIYAKKQDTLHQAEIFCYTLGKIKRFAN